MVRDTDGALWLIERNPRYPAWIYGATIAGHNMIVYLVEAAIGEAFRRPNSADANPEFIRVVIEIPVKAEVPLSPLPEPYAGGVGHSLKPPSGLLNFAEKLRKRNGLSTEDDLHQQALALPQVPAFCVRDILECIPETSHTPAVLFLESTAAAVLQGAAQSAQRASTGAVRVINGYSIKTNPDPRMLRGAWLAGFFAETISPLEVKAALGAGFLPEQILLNGLGKWWQPQHLPAKPS